MNEYKDERFHIKLDDGIVYVIFHKAYIDYNFVNDLILRRLEITKDIAYPMFSDFRAAKSGPREARQRMAEKDAGIGVKAVAILINSNVQRVIYNFFNNIYRAPAPARLFTSKEKALKWLQQYK